MTHAAKHDVSEDELREFFTSIPLFRRSRKDSSFVAVGKLQSTGRCLEVAYRFPAPGRIFIISAYDIVDRKLVDFLESRIDY